MFVLVFVVSVRTLSLSKRPISDLIFLLFPGASTSSATGNAPIVRG